MKRLEEPEHVYDRSISSPEEMNARVLKPIFALFFRVNEVAEEIDDQTAGEEVRNVPQAKYFPMITKNTTPEYDAV